MTSASLTFQEVTVGYLVPFCSGQHRGDMTLDSCRLRAVCQPLKINAALCVRLEVFRAGCLRHVMAHITR